MQYYRCKCGKAEYWGSGMVPAKCQGCDKCKTTYARGPEGHKEIAPHEWAEKTVIEEGKTSDESYCKKCYVKKRHAEKEKE